MMFEMRITLSFWYAYDNYVQYANFKIFKLIRFSKLLNVH